MGGQRAGFWTPWGEGTVVVADDALVGVELPELPPGDLATTGRQVTRPVRSGGASGGGAARWARQLEAYFAGERSSWSPDEVDLGGLRLTAFRAAVYRALLSVPAGETITYGELAAAAGRPGAARAVGTAMARNPIPIVVPCHRCVRGDGTLGRYGDDDRWKPLLLGFEGAR